MKEKNGKRSQFYDNMTLCEPGDIILSYAFGKVSHYGFITSIVSSSDKPLSIGSQWERDGWLVAFMPEQEVYLSYHRHHIFKKLAQS